MISQRASGQTAVVLEGRVLRRLILGLLGLALVVGGLPLDATADIGDHRCTDCDKIYHGNSRLFKRPCEISADEVYKHIPEYKEILEKGLTDKDVRYHFLMKKASQRFTEAVKQMARDMDHDMVAEKGTVKKAKKTAKDVPDRTDEVIKNLS